MFNNLKKKIADGVEGVSAGRQTPLRSFKKGGKNKDSPEVWPQISKRSDIDPENSPINFESPFGENHNGKHKSSPQEVLARVHHLLEVGRAQAQNNGRIDDNLDNSSDASQLQTNSFNHPLNENYMTSTPLEISQEDEPPSSLTDQNTHNTPLPHSNSHQRRLSTSSNRSNSSVQDDRGYQDSDAESSIRTDDLSVNELCELYRKQERTLRRYKQKFSEVVDAYKGLQKDKEKLEGTLTNGQDKQLRRIKELKETIELEQESKRHLEEALRMELNEKDDKIEVLKTQVALLKNKHGLPSPFKVSSSSRLDANDDFIQGLQDKISLLNVEVERLTADNKNAQALVHRGEQEKKTAIEGVMNNMHDMLNEQESLKSENTMLREELKNRDIAIFNMREKESNLEEQLMNEIRQTVLADALKQQEAELQAMFEEKEFQLKDLFADKVHDLQRVMEENEKQKQLSLHQKDSDVTKKNDEILILKEQLVEWAEKESKLKAKIQKIISEKEASDKKYSEIQQQLEQEKKKSTDLVAQHTKQMKEKQDEFNEQISKVKRTSQTKIYEAQDQLRKKTNELNEATEKYKTEIDSKVKESTQFMQSEHAKASRKLEVKISDMKKMIKELRQKLGEKESRCNELESSLLYTKTEVDQAKSLNTSLVESELKVGQLNSDMETVMEECNIWKTKYETLHQSFTDISLDLKTERRKCIDVIKDRDKISQDMQDMLENVKEDEGTLQNELNHLKTKFTDIEEQSKELTLQLHDKVEEIELLKERIEVIGEEKQHLIDTRKEEISLCETNLRVEYELKLDAKNELSNVFKDKESSVEAVTKRLEEMRKEELKEMEIRHEQQQKELHEELRRKIDNVEKKHKDFVKQNEEEKTRLILEKDEIIQKLENDLEFTKGNESKVVEILTKKIKDLTTTLDEIKVQNNQVQEELESKFNEQIDCINANYEREINSYKLQIESLDASKREYLNEVSKKYTEDKDSLFKQINEQTYDMSELKILCDQKDKDYKTLTEIQSKEKEELVEFKNLSSSLKDQVKEFEITWKEKNHCLEEKLKGTITENDTKYKKLIEEIKLKFDGEKEAIEDNFVTKESTQTQEYDYHISLMGQNIEDLNTQLNKNTETFEREITSLKLRESNALSQVEQSKNKNSDLKKRFENELSLLQKKSLEDKSLIEKLNNITLSGESTSKELDSRFSELLTEKSKLEQKISCDKHFYEEKISLLENEIERFKSMHDKNIRTLEDRLLDEANNFKKEKIILLTQHDEANNNKFMELKRKAEMKISKLKKEHSEKINDLESEKSELNTRINLLETKLGDLENNHEKHFVTSKQSEMKLMDDLNKCEHRLKSTQEHFEAKLLAKAKKITQIEDLLENATVSKMDALKTQKTQLDEEKDVCIKKIKDDCKKEILIIEKKLTAQIEEKDFEYSSEVKALLKDFQSKLGAKDMEIQQAVQDAIEVAQKDEKKIICEYDEQIVEFQRELRLREKDMLNLQQESQHQIDLLNEEREAAENESIKKFGEIEKEYHQRLNELTKRHEETIKKKNTSLEESDNNMNERLQKLVENHTSQVQELEDNYKNDMSSQEKKYKTQLKQAKLEIRKLLSNEGATIPNGVDYNPSGIPSSNNSDNEMDHTEVMKLKEKLANMSKELQSLREREKCLAMQAEQAPSTPTRNDRPATLQLSDNLNDTVSSPPKSPQPLEFEYLRNILYNYMMGKQRKQMAKVLTAIVHFSPSQVQQILAKVEEQESNTEKKSSSWL